MQVDALNAQLVAGHVEKVPGQHGKILAMLAQGRHGNGVDVQAVVEVAAETSGFDLAQQVAIGRGNEAHVDADDLVGTHALDFSLL